MRAVVKLDRFTTHIGVKIKNVLIHHHLVEIMCDQTYLLLVAASAISFQRVLSFNRHPLVNT